MSSFIEMTKQKARENLQTIVLAEGEEIRNLNACATAIKEGIANIILLGNQEKIKQVADGLDISKATIIDPEKDSRFNDFVIKFYEMRKEKGVDMEKAKDTMKNTLYFGAMLVKMGYADGMVTGAIHSTGDVMRAALQVVKTAPNTKIVSSFFVMCVPDCTFGNSGTFIYSDCGLIQDPSAEELCEIAISSSKSYTDLVGGTPAVAMLSHSTYGSAKGPLVEKVQQATAMAKEKRPDILLDGELQFDAAIIPEIGKSKAPNSAVAGKANVLIFPNLDAGNIGYKLTERLAKAQAYGPVTQGIAKPINDLSRGCNADDIVGVIAITCVQAQNQEK